MDWPGLYGTIIRATGWTFEYVDGLSMGRVLEFLDYLGRVPGARLTMAPEERDRKAEVGPEDIVGQYRALQRWFPETARMSPEARTMIEWAEAEKARRGVN